MGNREVFPLNSFILLLTYRWRHRGLSANICPAIAEQLCSLTNAPFQPRIFAIAFSIAKCITSRTHRLVYTIRIIYLAVNLTWILSSANTSTSWTVTQICATVAAVAITEFFVSVSWANWEVSFCARVIHAFSALWQYSQISIRAMHHNRRTKSIGNELTWGLGVVGFPVGNNDGLTVGVMVGLS